MYCASIRIGRRAKGPVLALLSTDHAAADLGDLPKALARRVAAGSGLRLASQVTLFPGEGTGHDHVVAVQVHEDEERDRLEWWRLAGARVVRALAGLGATKAQLRAPGADAAQVEALCEGALLASYRFTEYLSSPPQEGQLDLRLDVPGGASSKDAKAALARAEQVAASVGLTRDLVNRPAADLYPDSFADVARGVGKARGMKVQVIKGKALETGFPSIHAVGKGSDRPPCLIRLDWRPKGKDLAHFVLVGKGITYDSGGYHVKPLQSMYLMKKDMGGAGAVLGAIDLVAARQLPVRVTALLACAENMISGGSFRPGDILQTRSGQSVEVYSTDAEGRLVLSDALTYASELEPDGILDLATLTGAAKRFVADLASPVMGDHELVADMVVAGERSGDRLMPFELLREYRESVRGTISDLRNTGKVNGASAGTLVAGGFLSHFVGSTPWAHVDMSNTSWADADLDLNTKGATGFGVRVLAEMLAERAYRD